jgi:hypothetical protein
MAILAVLLDDKDVLDSGYYRNTFLINDGTNPTLCAQHLLFWYPGEPPIQNTSGIDVSA